MAWTNAYAKKENKVYSGTHIPAIRATSNNSGNHTRCVFDINRSDGFTTITIQNMEATNMQNALIKLDTGDTTQEVIFFNQASGGVKRNTATIPYRASDGYSSLRLEGTATAAYGSVKASNVVFS